MKIRHSFNLIEIALAIAIVAVGISSIMVLFPVGINATNDAVADNNIPDAAEYMLSFLEASTQAAWKDDNGNSTTSNPNKFIDQIPTGTIAESAKNPAQPDLPANTKYHSFGNGIFWFQQASENNGINVIDFAAIMSVTREQVKVYYKLPNDTTDPNNQTPEIPYDQAVSYKVEISYPAEKPYNARQKAIYWLDVYNQTKLN